MGYIHANFGVDRLIAQAVLLLQREHTDMCTKSQVQTIALRTVWLYRRAGVGSERKATYIFDVLRGRRFKETRAAHLTAAHVDAVDSAPHEINYPHPLMHKVAKMVT